MVPVVPISFYLNVIIMLFHLEMQPVWFGSHDLGLCSQGFMLSEGRARFRQVSLTESHRTWGWFLSSCFLLKVHRFITCHNHELRYPPFSDPTTILSWWYIYISPWVHPQIEEISKPLSGGIHWFPALDLPSIPCCFIKFFIQHVSQECHGWSSFSHWSSFPIKTVRRKSMFFRWQNNITTFHKLSLVKWI